MFEVYKCMKITKNTFFYYYILYKAFILGDMKKNYFYIILNVKLKKTEFCKTSYIYKAESIDFTAFLKLTFLTYMAFSNVKLQDI